MARIYIYTVFIAGVVVAGFVIGMLNLPGEWYGELAKPVFNPPDWLFAPVWSLLYVLIGWVGARVFLARRIRPRLMLDWAVLLVLNFLWPPAFFGIQLPMLGLAIIILLFLGLLCFVAYAWRHDRVSAVLFLPYLVWVGFAMALNGAIVYLN
ncbi:tryptophan-rich sensory protein [Martelella alba]|uniref:Tryptophan-rich sensory protein n=1 Tax=Martelella alba TaxID=2590451 RepID=A0A506U2W0_9HYPH|nr:TspO/MBR family protein [Martelella alba]TPW27818.1 tryptophan-rich sensory protein [Martelella alba]